MTNSEILKILPESEAENFNAVTPQCPENFWRQGLFEARGELEKRLHQTGHAAIADIMDLIPSDPCNFEQIIATAEGRELIRANIATARRLLENLE